MKKKMNAKRIIAAITVLTMSIGMIGCGKKVYSEEEASSTVALVVGDYDVYMDEAVLYAMQAIYTQTLYSSSWTDASEATNKNMALSLLRENKILYDVAIKNNTELTDSEKEYVNTSIQSFKNTFGEEVLEKYGISDDTLNMVFTEQAIVSKFETNIRNEMGQEMNDDLVENYKNTEFHTAYYLMFPFVEVDENNEPKKDEDGNYIYFDDEAKSEVLASATEAVEKLRAGESYESILEEYGIAEYSFEQNGYTGGYASDALNDEVEKLNDGDCTDPYEVTLGYAVLVMITASDDSLKQAYIDSLTNDNLSEQFEKLETQWLATIPVDAEKDIQGTAWNDFNMKNVAIDMEKAGIIEPQ